MTQPKINDDSARFLIELVVWANRVREYSAATYGEDQEPPPLDKRRVTTQWNTEHINEIVDQLVSHELITTRVIGTDGRKRDLVGVLPTPTGYLYVAAWHEAQAKAMRDRYR